MTSWKQFLATLKLSNVTYRLAPPEVKDMITAFVKGIVKAGHNADDLFPTSFESSTVATLFSKPCSSTYILRDKAEISGSELMAATGAPTTVSTSDDVSFAGATGSAGAGAAIGGTGGAGEESKAKSGGVEFAGNTNTTSGGFVAAPPAEQEDQEASGIAAEEFKAIMTEFEGMPSYRKMKS
jgi:hypothetical protein